MDYNRFWAIIDRCDAASAGDMEEKERLIKAEISRLSVDDAASFIKIFNEFMDKAYTWPLWGAACLINGGCGDDSFSDFRASLISRGQSAFDRALMDPDSLAAENIDLDSWFHEGFEYAVSDAVKTKIGHPPKRDRPEPSQPVGQRWSEGNLQQLYPRLVQKLRSGSN